MNRALATIALLILSNTFMTLAWYGHIAFKSKIERFGMLSIILLSWGIALFEYCFQVPANRIGSSQLGGPFSIWELKVIQEVISLLVFTVFAVVLIPDNWRDFTCNVSYGGSEGIYLDISLNTASGSQSFITGKTLSEDVESFLNMSRAAAECNIMLNGNGSVKALPRDIAEYLEYMSEIEDKDYSIEDTDEMER